MSLPWTKRFSPSDDGTSLRGVDLRNIQDDIDSYITVNPSSGTVNTTGDQTISGVKTFSTAPVLPNGSVTNAMLDTIDTAGVISGASLTSLASIPASAGPIPAANLPFAGVSAWVTFDGKTGGVATVKASSNVTSVTRNSTGRYTIVYTAALADAYAAVVATVKYDSGAQNVRLWSSSETGCVISVTDTGNSAEADSSFISVVVIR